MGARNWPYAISNPRCRMYMPVQVRMIVEAIGEP